jgi:hypothetical protein
LFDREVVVAITDGRLDDPAQPSGRGLGEVFGPWRQIFGASRNGWLVSLDGRRRKRVLVKVVGE